MCEEDMWRRRRRRRRREKEPGGTDPKTRTPQNDVGKKDEVDGEVRRENGEGEAGEAGQGGNEEERQDEDAYEIRVFKAALPVRSKTAREATRVAMEMVLKLRMDGYPQRQGPRVSWIFRDLDDVARHPLDNDFQR